MTELLLNLDIEMNVFERKMKVFLSSNAELVCVNIHAYSVISRLYSMFLVSNKVMWNENCSTV